MAEIKLNLREPNSLKETPINLVLRFNNKKLVYSTGKKVNPKHWDSTKQRIKKTKDFPQASLIDSSLNEMIHTVYSELETYQKNNSQHFPETEEFKTILDIKFGRAVIEKKKTFFEFIDWFTHEYAPKKYIITNHQTSLTNSNTIRTYETTLRLLHIYASDKEYFDFNDINMKWYFEFTDWCNKVKNYNPSTIGKHIKVLKLWLRKAEEDGLHNNTVYKRKDFRKPNYLPETIYLNRTELDFILKLDLSNRVELDRIRDLFLIGCWTGLRFSDFNRLQGMHCDEDFIRIKTKKTLATAVIPINSIVKNILKKYDNSVPSNYANQYMNRQIKVICKMAGITSEASRAEFINGKKNEINVQKWELVTTHTARRSFATNLYGLVPNRTIMAITTHRTETAFLRYLRKSNEEHAQILKVALDSF